MISNKRRVTIIVISVFAGTILSIGMFMLRRGGQPLTTNDTNALITNFIFSIAIILGVGFLFLWNNKNNKTGL